MRLQSLSRHTNLIVFLCYILWPTVVLSQSAPDSLFSKTVRQIWSGNPFILRDIGTYLDDEQLGKEAENYLRAYTLFTKDEFDWSARKSKQDFLDFFYKNRDRIYLDHAVDMYLISPLETQPFSDFLARPITTKNENSKERLKRLIQKAESTQQVDSFVTYINQIARFHNADAWYQILLFSERAAEKTDFFDPYPALANGLRFCPDMNGLYLLQKWIQADKISPSDAEIPLSELLNCFIPTVTKEYMLALIKMRIKGNKSIYAIKKIGFEDINGMRPTFFQDSVDYYGILLGSSGSKPWAKNNARAQLLRSRSPRSLYYLATEVLQRRSYIELYKNKTDALQPAFGLLQELTQLEIHVQNSAGNVTATEIDYVWALNFLKYWANHYQDYIWDEIQGRFINRLRAETVRELTQNLFSRLNSSSDSIALDAFQKLTKMNIDLVAPLAEEYRSFGQRPNPTIPSMRLPILEQMTKFTEACQQYGQTCEPSPPLSSFLKKLQTQTTAKDRQSLEDDLIRTLTLEQISSLEYAALLYSQNTDFSLSMSRIIDQLYAKNWQQILDKETKVRFFLKKSALLKAIGSHGTCNRYASFFEKNKQNSQPLLEHLAEKETDRDILNAIQFSLTFLDNSKANVKLKKQEEPFSSAQFDNELLHLQSRTEVPYKALNQILQSSFFSTEKHLSVCLDMMKKLPQTQDVLLLDFPEKLSLDKHLSYFDSLDFDNRSLSQLPRIFSGTQPDLLFDFYLKKTKNKTFEERGQILTKALSVHWVVAYLMTLEQEDNKTSAIKKALQSYLDDSEYLSEFEENQLRFLLLLYNTIGTSIAQKLESAFQIGASYRVEQELLAYVQWEDLPKLAPYIEYLQPSPEGIPGYLFLNRDFGLPPLPFNQPLVYGLYFPSTKKLEKSAVYRKALIDFGLLDPHEEEVGQLYRILQRERISPYIGSGGFFRDWGVLAAVKLLEHRFGETFGFAEKLNENQTFYIYNSGDRALRWISFLEENGLVGNGDKVQTWQ